MHGNEHMSRYAVKIGEITLRSDKPITLDEQKRALNQLAQAYRGVFLVTSDGVEIAATVTVGG